MHKLISFFYIIFISCSAWSLSYEDYIWIHNSNYCANYFEHFEQKYNLPKHLLRSVSVAETGRWHKTAKLYFSWPWAVNQAGKAYYFPSKSAAISAVAAMLKEGKTNIDVGCMQINLHHHPRAFANLEQAFDPKTNIEYAANYIKSHYNELKNWQQAIAYYHSQGEIGQTYALKVLKLWLGYSSNKLFYNHCTSSSGDLEPCNAEKTVSNEVVKETLPLTKLDDKNDDVVAMSKPRKELKRLKSAMIPYTNNNEILN